MQDAVSEWLAAARHRFLVGYARSVIDSVGPAGAEFARIAEYLWSWGLLLDGGLRADRPVRRRVWRRH
jgi:hypothetical protein